MFCPGKSRDLGRFCPGIPDNETLQGLESLLVTHIGG